MKDQDVIEIKKPKYKLTQVVKQTNPTPPKANLVE